MTKALAAQEVALEGWREEQRSAYLYRVLATIEPDPIKSKTFGDLGKAAEEQSQIWGQPLLDAGRALPSAFKPDTRTRLVAMLVRRFGPRPMRGVLAAMKVRGMSLYSSGPAGHHAMPQNAEEIGLHHAGVKRGGALRAAVFGVNDGLISNASLLLGIVGASADEHVVVLSGVAGLLAGAFSMAAGEYVSVRSQREMFEHQIDLEREELQLYPEEEAEELALIYHARGMSKEEALTLAQKVTSNPEHALDALTREELGLNPDELSSPWEAAWSSLAAFAIGALIPLLPFLFHAGRASLALSIGLTGLSLLGVGMLLSLFTGRGAWKSGFRMLFIGLLSGTAAYVAGSLLGVSLK
jgi:vacuolar iron transporter family protein